MVHFEGSYVHFRLLAHFPHKILDIDNPVACPSRILRRGSQPADVSIALEDWVNPRCTIAIRKLKGRCAF